MASETGPIKVLHVGLGPIGAAVVRQVAERKGFRIVGAADIDPAKVGRDLGEIAHAASLWFSIVVSRRRTAARAPGRPARTAATGRPARW